MNFKKWFLVTLCALPTIVHAAGPTLQEQQEATAEIDKIQAQLDLYPTADFVMDYYHEYFSDKIPLLLHRKLDLFAKLRATTPAQKFYLARSRMLDSAILSMYEPQVLEQLKTTAASTKPDESRPAQLALIMHEYWSHPSSQSQTKILNDLEPLALKDSSDNLYTAALLDLHDLAPADRSIAARIDAFVLDKLHSTLALQYKARPNKIDHPLKIVGTTSDGRPFSSDKWKGKVVLVDFWATWCPPCLEDLPKVVQIYEQYHAKGVEIIGISCDSDRQELTTFLKAHKEMPWPSLFGPSRISNLHILGDAYGITGIPKMYIIDKNGILRSMNGWHDRDKLIPILLDEPVAATQPSSSTKPAPIK